MSREEALAHFRQQAVPLARQKVLREFMECWKEEKTAWMSEFVHSFQELCMSIRMKQLAGEKGRIGFITYSMLRTDIAHGRASYLVQASDASWLFDFRPGEDTYDASWAFYYLDRLMDEVTRAATDYSGAVTLPQLDRIRLLEAEHFHRFVVSLIRRSLMEAAALPEFKELKKEAVFEVRVGEYLSHSECVFRLDERERGSEEVRAWLQEKNDSAAYTYEDFYRFDLSGGDYRTLDFRYSSFRNCDLKNSRLGEGFLLGTVWNDCQLDSADFAYSLVQGANYSGCSMKASIFRCAQGKAGMPVPDWAPPGVEGVRVTDCDLEEADFARAKLDGAVFVRTCLRGANFRGASLQGVRFQKSDLTNADFREADMTDTDFSDSCLDGALFPEREACLSQSQGKGSPS
ncbi:pentapeptide repeat-containing protein [Paenibacillus thiaminolyticus]|nr:pentapeptide repeat-containing protein [Paenibacillus thiaminolyticus]